MSASRRVGLVTCRALPEPDLDQDLLLAALHDAGVEADLVAWDAPGVDSLETFDRLVIRSCWNYHETPAEFMAWIDSVDRLTQLLNPAPMVRWNLHKGYLRSLASAGVPTVPTAWFRRQETGALRDMIARTGWDDIVVKPAISASSWRTHRFQRDRDEMTGAERVLKQLLHDRDAMVQPYMSGVESEGEKVVVWIDGEVTHAIRKTPRFAAGVEVVSRAIDVSTAERVIAERSIAVAVTETGVRPLYARVDLMPDSEKGPMVSELELIEPSLYLRQSPAALDRFVRAIATTPAS